MIAIPNIGKPQSCDECPIRIAELFGVYYKDGKSKRITITGCDSSKYNGKTIAEEEKMMYEHCPLIDIVRCGECRHYYDGLCEHPVADGTLGTDPTDSCSYGERRSDVNNTERD